MIDINNFKVEVSCEYKGEIYSVRDNGAIMRHPKKGCRIRPLDNKWTFGTKNENNGYMFFASNIRVHQVVASAFWGHQKSEGMVVDHKDTNRCNNRAENLHWVTRLENVLNNPITRRRVINICGSISAFLENPALLRESTADPNFTWMRTVSEEEAAKCKANLERWSHEDADFISTSQGKGIGEWIFNDLRSNRRSNDMHQRWTQIKASEYPITQANDQDDMHQRWTQIKASEYPITQANDQNDMHQRWTQIKASEYPITQANDQDEHPAPLLVESLTTNAMQEDWRTPTEFPLCPPYVLSVEDYYSSLEKGKVFSKNTYGVSTIIEAAISVDKKQLCVATHNPEALKRWCIAYVYILDNKFIHKNGGSFFSETGALKEITLFQGKEWTGDDCIDDYC